MGAETATDEAWHRTLHTVLACDVVRRLDHCVIAHSHRLLAQARVVSDLTCSVEHVKVKMHPGPSSLTSLHIGVDALFDDILSLHPQLLISLVIAKLTQVPSDPTFNLTQTSLLRFVIFTVG